MSIDLKPLSTALKEITLTSSFLTQSYEEYTKVIQITKQ